MTALIWLAIKTWFGRQSISTLLSIAGIAIAAILVLAGGWYVHSMSQELAVKRVELVNAQTENKRLTGTIDALNEQMRRTAQATNKLNDDNLTDSARWNELFAETGTMFDEADRKPDALLQDLNRLNARANRLLEQASGAADAAAR